ncbi:MAG: 1,4-dihydroxy-2-naphthoate octaprenyltransferase [Candidatus Omnitrophota bacterium]|nr:1,4-dihydroxy-2-naphthoate octaprenyltransferase [Candidatus Omnitrophota bacterium]
MINFKRLAIWIKATRAPFLTATLVPVILGTVIAWSETGRFSIINFILVVTGISFLHTGTNLMNDYFDHRTGNDLSNKNYTPFNGGSRVIQDGLIRPKGILLFSLACFVIGSIIGLWINYTLKTNVVLFMGIIGVFLGIFYTAEPLKIGYLGIGEIIVGFCFGPLVALGAYYVQAIEFSWPAFCASIPVGILVALILFINEFPDYEADKMVNKNTFVVLLGKERAVMLFNIFLRLVYIIIAVCAIFKTLPWVILITFLTIPAAFRIMEVSRKNFDKISELLPANAGVIKVHIMVGFLMSASFLLKALF